MAVSMQRPQSNIFFITFQVASPTVTTMTSSMSPLNSSKTTPTAATSPVKNTNPRVRNPNDPNRLPLYNDERLPPGWHRKVSQRKSGASIGRYEVFIISPVSWTILHFFSEMLAPLSSASFCGHLVLK